MVWDHHRRRVESKEDSRIVSMQDEVNSLLLDRDGMGYTSINSTTYQALLSHHLAAFTTGKMDFSTTNKRDLVNAHNLLKARGLPLSLLGQWVEPYVGTPKVPEENWSQVTLGLGEGQEHATGTVGPEQVRQDAARSKVRYPPGEQLNVAKGRPPVRRKYVHMDNETPSARPKAIPTGQVLKKTSSNVPFLKLNSPSPHHLHQVRRPGSIITNNKSVVGQDVIQAPSKLDVVTSNTSPVFEDLAQPTSLPISTVIPQADSMKDFDSMTIVVQPKRTWSGTAKPSRTTVIHSATLQTPIVEDSIHKMWRNASGNPGVSRQSSEALERLRIESMKYSGKSVAGISEPAKMNDASTQADVQNGVKGRNLKELVVRVSKGPSTTPKQRVRRASNTSSTTKRNTAIAITPTATPKDRSTPATPDLPSSGSSTRSPMATRKPSRYRDGLTNAASPTDSIPGTRASNQQAVAIGTETNGLFSSVYELSKHRALNLKTKDMPDHPELAPGLNTTRRLSLGLPERKQTVRRQSAQPIQPQLILSDSRNESRRDASAESVDLIATSIEVTKNTALESGGKAPRKTPSKSLISGASDAEKTAESKVGGKAPRKAPRKPPSPAGKAPRKTPSKLPPSELIAAEDGQSNTTRDTTKVKTAEPKAKRNKAMMGRLALS